MIMEIRGEDEDAVDNDLETAEELSLDSINAQNLEKETLFLFREKVNNHVQ